MQEELSSAHGSDKHHPDGRESKEETECKNHPSSHLALVSK
jgi:hypothetical protein